MQLTQLEIKRELEQAKREGRWGDVEELEILMAAIDDTPPAPTPPTSTYVLQEGDDPFVVSERELGSVEHVPRLLRTNPSSSWTPGTEIELPEIEDGEPNSGALVDLFETIGPPGPNWTADDWAVLDAVREEIEAGQHGGGGDEEGPAAEQAAAGTEVETPEEEDDAPAPDSGELPPELADIELPEEQAQAVAEYLAQMLTGGQLGDPFVVSGGQAPDGRQAPPKLVDTQRQGEYEIDEAKDWLEQWYRQALEEAYQSGGDAEALRAQYEEYQAQIAAGQMGAEDAKALMAPADDPTYLQEPVSVSDLEEMVEQAGYDSSLFEFDALTEEDSIRFTQLLSDPAGGSPIELYDAILQIDTVQKYLGLTTREAVSLLRELYYPSALDPFIAGASSVTWDLQPIANEQNGVSPSTAALALNLLLISKPPGGYLDPDHPEAGYKPPLLQISYDGKVIGLDHVIAAMDAYYNPISGFVEDNKLAWGVDFLAGIGEGELDTVAAVTYLGDLGGAVWQGILREDQDAGYSIEMPEEDIEGDVMAIAIAGSGMLDNEDFSLADVLRIAYNPNLDIYPNRYGIFAESIGLEADPETHEVVNRQEFVKENLSLITAFGTGLYITGYAEEGESGQLRGAQVDDLLVRAGDYALQGIDSFLKRVESELQNE